MFRPDRPFSPAGLGCGPGGHVRESAAVLTRMRLRAGDLLYLSDLIEPGCLAPSGGSIPPERCDDQGRALLAAWQPHDPTAPPRVASYDLREFVY